MINKLSVVKKLIVGVPKEIKKDENRVGITPAGVAELVKAGHEVRIEKGAGAGSHISDNRFQEAGAQLADRASDVYAADLVVKVKEPISKEYAYFRKDQIIFCFLHLAAEKALTSALIDAGVIAVGYETVQQEDGRLPLLAPMSEVAGRLAPQLGARFLEKTQGGRGLLLGGVAGVPPAKVGIVGGGIVGNNAAAIALGFGAGVTIADTNIDRLRYLEEISGGRIITCASNTVSLAETVSESDLLIGAVLTPGAKAPKLVTREMIASMKTGSVIVDVAVDQGGCVATTVPTTHSDPIRIIDGVVHCGITNIPSAVPHTSTYALTNTTLSWLLELANKGWRQSGSDNRALARGFNVVQGRVVHKQVAKSLGLEHTAVGEVL